MKSAFVFPGQGSQTVGMGKEMFDAFPEARDVFHEVDDTLSRFLTKLIFEGPIEELTLTENAQPAIMTVSIAIMRVIEKQGGKPLSALASYVAGHSLGEYSALCTAGTFSLTDTAKLLEIRSRSMQEACPRGIGAMAALIGADIATAKAITEKASDGQVCQVANDNSEGQIVISGIKEAVLRAEAISKEMGVKRFVLLPVSAPFHSMLMEPAARKMADALTATAAETPSVPLIANVTADEVTDVEEIKELLVEQVTGSVRWRESIIQLGSKGVTRTVEVGGGKVLTGLTKRCVKEMEAIAIGTPQELEAFLKG